MNQTEAIRGQLSQIIQKIQSDGSTHCATAQELAGAVYRANANIYPQGLAWAEFVRAVEKLAVELNLLLPGGTVPGIAIDTPLSLNSGGISNARAAQVANQQLRNRGGVNCHLSMDAGNDAKLDDDHADDGLDRQRRILKAIIALGDAAPKDCAALAAMLLSRDPNLKAPGASLQDFAAEIAKACDVLKADCAGATLSMNGNISNDRAEQIVDQQTGQRREKKTPPGLAAMIERMTPQQRRRWEEIMAKQNAERAVNEEAKLDLLMDFLEGKVGQRA